MRAILLLSLLALFLPAGAAEECVITTSTTNDRQIVLEATTPAADYVAIDLCQPDCVFSIWPYFERNGIEGLQRQDEVVDDTCGGRIDGDSWFHI